MGGQKFAVGSHRHDVIEWTTKRTFTAGVKNALWSPEVL
jgi:hypothetical protein